MYVLRFVALAALSLPGCGGTALAPGDGGATPPDPQPAIAQPDLAGLKTIEVSIGPIHVEPGGETTVCTTFRLPIDADSDVVQIDAALKPGSHHLVLYKSNDTHESLTPGACELLIEGVADQVQGKPPRVIPLFIAETQSNNTLNLPSGVAYHMPAHQMASLEAHYVNATPNALDGMGTVRLTLGTGGSSFTPADIMFCGSLTPLARQIGGAGVPPGMSSLDPGYYRPPAGTKFFGFTTHQHRRGSLMTLSKSSGAADPGTLLLNGQPWDNEPFLRFDDQHLMTFAPNEGIRWQCFYDNPDPQTIYFGPSAQNNEMCFLWAYYFPSAGRFISYPDCIR